MAFDILLQINNSEDNKVTKNLTLIATLNGTLKAETSLLDPTFIIESDLSTVAGCNYLTVSDFGRSYFIKDIRSLRNNLVEIRCHVDVLMSFAEEIKANYGIVRRQESDWNLYLNDGVLKVYQNPIVTTHAFPTGFEGESYILALAGRRSGGLLPGAGGNAEGAKTSRGLAAYALAQLGLPYWMGTFGQTADADLYNNRKSAYPQYYTASDYASQYGQRVHDCVGIIKGYRWSETPTSTPVYNAVEDVSASGLFAQCSRVMGAIGDANWRGLYASYPGICVFTNALDHVGVSMGDGTVVEARGHAYGVVRTNLVDRNFVYYGQPDWMADNTGLPIN